MREINPCYKCPDRRAATKDRPSCHATCEKYIEWKAAWAEEHHYKPNPGVDMACDSIAKMRFHKQKERRRRNRR